MTEPYADSVYSEIAKQCWPEDHAGLFYIHRLEVRAIHLGRERAHTFLTKDEKAKVAAALAAVAEVLGG